MLSNNRFAWRSFTRHCLIAALLTLSCSAMAAHPTGTPGSVVATPPDMTYFALQGDTLSGISKRFTDKAMNWKVLSKRNKIADDRAIPVGTAILIPLELLPEEESQARVVALAGTPSYLPANDGQETALAVGSIVKEGGKIITGKNGFLTLALPDESRISIPSNSQVKVSKLRQTRFTASPRTELALLEGKVESRVSSLSSNQGRFEVRTPLAIAGVRGTHFRVGVSDASTGNEVLEGGVAVDSAAGKKNTGLVLPAGKGNIIDTHGVGKAIDLLPAPVLAADYSLQIRPTVQFSVQPMAAAAAYRVQISKDQQALDVLTENRFKENRFKFDGLPDGQYFIRVTAIDRLGLEGLPMLQAFTLKARPEPPFSIQPKNKVRTEAVDFVWTEAAQVDFYHLQIARDSEFKDLVADRNQIREVQLPGIPLPLGQYFWRVATVIQKNGVTDQGPYSDTQAFVVAQPQAQASMGDSDGKQMSFSWSSEPGQRFLIQIATDPAFHTLYLTKELDQAELKIAQPAAGQYYLRVRATDPDGYVGAFSATQKITILPQWTSGTGEPVVSGGQVVRPGF